jgi:hypothetical protein
MPGQRRHDRGIVAPPSTPTAIRSVTPTEAGPRRERRRAERDDRGRANRSREDSAASPILAGPPRTTTPSMKTLRTVPSTWVFDEGLTIRVDRAELAAPLLPGGPLGPCPAWTSTHRVDAVGRMAQGTQPHSTGAERSPCTQPSWPAALLTGRSATAGSPRSRVVRGVAVQRRRPSASQDGGGRDRLNSVASRPRERRRR